MNIYCGREFSHDDIQVIRRVMAENPTLRRTPLSRRLCELFEWTKPNGELKDMTCRVALLRMQADGLITLPRSRISCVRRRPHFVPTAATDAQTRLLRPVHELGALTLRPVTSTTTSRLWSEYVARYHYLGYTPLAAARIPPNASPAAQCLDLLTFGRTLGSPPR